LSNNKQLVLLPPYLCDKHLNMMRWVMSRNITEVKNSKTLEYNICFIFIFFWLCDPNSTSLKEFHSKKIV